VRTPDRAANSSGQNSAMNYEFADPAHSEQYSSEPPVAAGPFAAHPNRYAGPGDPLFESSWQNRPLDVGVFAGGMQGDKLLDDEKQGVNVFGGLRLGWDFDHYWGGELRFAWASLPLKDHVVSASDQHQDSIFYGDVDFFYYPWGDSRWRPFVTMGLGLGTFNFTEASGIRHDETLPTLPIGCGIKYMIRDWLVLRADLTDNIAFGGNSGLNTMNNFSITGGVEYRFGGSRPSYFPWYSQPYVW
jgi:hypothetical protein